MANDPTGVTLPLDPGWADIRDGVKRICDQFPNEYWVKLDHAGDYPTEFVKALTEAGYLSALIPEDYGGSGLPLSGRVRRAGDHPRQPLQRRVARPPRG